MKRYIKVLSLVMAFILLASNTTLTNAFDLSEFRVASTQYDVPMTNDEIEDKMSTSIEENEYESIIHTITYYDEIGNIKSELEYTENSVAEVTSIPELEHCTQYWVDENNNKVSDTLVMDRDYTLTLVSIKDVMVTFNYILEDGTYEVSEVEYYKEGDKINFPTGHKWDNNTKIAAGESMIFFEVKGKIVEPLTKNTLKTLYKETPTGSPSVSPLLSSPNPSSIPGIVPTCTPKIDSDVIETPTSTPIIENTEEVIEEEETGEYLITQWEYVSEIKMANAEVIAVWGIGETNETDVIATLYDNGLLDITADPDVITVDNPTVKTKSDLDASNYWGNQTSYASQITDYHIADDVIPVNMSNWFRGSKITTAYDIPDGAVNLTATFLETGVTNIPNFPDTVTTIAACFYNCSNLEGIVPTLPDSIIAMNSAFQECPKITGITNIPAYLENGNEAFRNSHGLTGNIPTLPDTITTMYSMFYYAGQLTGEIENLPDNCTNMNYAFEGIPITGTLPEFGDATTTANFAFKKTGITGLTNLPPNGQDFSNMFAECTSLTGVIPAFPDSASDLGGMFRSCTSLTGPITNFSDNISNLINTFDGCTSLTGTIPEIPDSVNSMWFAFSECSKLTGDIKFKSQRYFSGTMQGAFKNCAGLDGTIINFPTGVTELVETFRYCISLTGQFPDISTSSATNLSNAFDSCMSLTGPMSDLPQNCVNYWCAFINCTSLDGDLPEIPDAAKYLHCAFSGDKKLTGNIVLGENIEDLSETFRYCSGLDGVITNIPDSIDDMQYAFAECSSITGTIPAFPQNDNAMCLYQTFVGCSSITGFTNMPKTARSMVLAFGYCSSMAGELESLPTGCTSLDETFRYCSSLTGSVPDIPDTITSMNYAFQVCSSLDGTIGKLSANLVNAWYAFDGCTSLTGSVPEMPLTIENTEAMFQWCNALKGTISELPESLVKMNSMFKGCSGLTGSFPEFPSSIKYLEAAYESCSSITGSVPKIPEGVVSASWLFKNCTGVTGIVPNFPSTIESAYYTYENCIGLTSLSEGYTFPNDTTGTFYHCESLTGTIVIPNNVTKMENVFTATKITEVTIPESVTSTGSSFMFCNKLTKITVLGNTDISVGGWDFRTADYEMVPTTLITTNQNMKNYDWYGNTRLINADYIVRVPKTLDLVKNDTNDFTVKVVKLYSPVRTFSISSDSEIELTDESGNVKSTKCNVTLDSYSFVGKENGNPTFSEDEPLILNGTIEVPDLTAGIWTGTFNINISMFN